MHSSLFLLVMCFSFAGCSLNFGKQEDPPSAKGTRYTVHFGSSEWLQKNDKRSDYVFENKSDGRVLLSNSFCHEFQDHPLQLLANKTFKKIKKFVMVASKSTTFHDREAYQIEGNGYVDGALVGLHLLNTRRDDCYFDFMAISPAASAQAGKIDFDHFLKSVEFK